MISKSINELEQKTYFEKEAHRFPPRNLLELTTAQLIEMQEIEAELDLSSNSKILDFGSGNGRVSLYFLSKGFDVVATDISKGSLLQLRKIYHDNKKDFWGQLECRESLHSDIKVDGIVGADILHHISIKKFVPRFYDLLKIGGKMVFSEPNSFHFPWYVHYIRNRIPLSVEKGIFQCNLPYLTYLMKHTEFKSFTITGHGLIPTPLWTGDLNFNLGDNSFLRFFAFRFLISAQK